jgi:hypothetical protein
MCLLRMILIALSAFVAGVVVAHAASLSCDEAREHLGEDATVCGLVASAKYYQRGRKPTFLNLCKAYPNHVFTALIWGTDRDKFFGKCGQPEPEKLEGKNICVMGIESTPWRSPRDCRRYPISESTSKRAG